MIPPVAALGIALLVGPVCFYILWELAGATVKIVDGKNWLALLLIAYVSIAVGLILIGVIQGAD